MKELIIFLAMVASGVLIGGFCWVYTLNTWLVYFGQLAVVEFWHGALIGLVPGLGQFGVVTAALTWITMLFIA
jgi:hypothetical protein